MRVHAANTAGRFARLLTVGGFLLIAAGGAGTAVANEKQDSPEVQVSSAISAWLQPEKRSVSREERMQQRMLASKRNTIPGNGSYICSASGSGARSSCIAR